nr:PspC domain-containing protein [candidate division Zixibacteria bacterium]
MSKKLYRSRVDRKIAGVCGGVGEYFGVDPTLVRILAILLVFADGIGLIAYIVAWIIMPHRPFGMEETKPVYDNNQWKKFWPGVLLIGLGIIFLLKNIYWWFDFWDFFWPAILIAVGLALILHRKSGSIDTTGPIHNAGEVN